MSGYFEGIYYKHQKGNHTICFIVGHANSGSFIQVITNSSVHQYDDLSGCHFGPEGIAIDLPQVQGSIHYGPLLPLASNIMGPFRFLPMQCSHSVYSMAHTLTGSLTIDGQPIDLTGGLGYMEGDRGRSFPKRYLWLHCNSFEEPCSIMASVAHIPFCGFAFTGCICAIVYAGHEYRLATYCGVRIVAASPERLVLRQGPYLLDIAIDGRQAHPLRAPLAGQMTQTIHESNCSRARFRFWVNGKRVFDLRSENVSFECNL